MAQIAVLICGENYLLAMEDGPPQKMDFCVWRCVEADTQEEAGRMALLSVRNDAEFNRSVLNAPGDPPILLVDEMRMGYGDLKPPGSGFILWASYDEGDDFEQETEGFVGSVASRFRRLWERCYATIRKR